jgi:hypothetical protein
MIDASQFFNLVHEVEGVHFLNGGLLVGGSAHWGKPHWEPLALVDLDELSEQALVRMLHLDREEFGGELLS